MSDDFRPGDLVECLRDPEVPECPLPALQVGGLYTVAEFYPASECQDGFPGLDLREVRPDPVWCYHAPNFRKIYRPDPKLIERLTAEPLSMPPADKPARVNEDA